MLNGHLWTSIWLHYFAFFYISSDFEVKPYKPKYLKQMTILDYLGYMFKLEQSIRRAWKKASENPNNKIHMNLLQSNHIFGHSSFEF